ncbi:hypothetical protein [Sphingomonas sp. BK580]|uniref:hypothetical protein n=1 Tax=Sphingomonas sp. BK580 TaxID=2586972 RepID=UPI0016170D6D|nr:hypothetical protein [Sphingomonas sp. BK580]MBB3695167.1 hypothetical protein [Sphingomonas sp. BK580]
MDRSSASPQPHEQGVRGFSPSGWLVIGSAALAIATAVLAGMLLSGDKNMQLEALKVVMQFLLVTVIGGIMLALLQRQRDADARRLEASREKERYRNGVAEGLQALFDEVGDAYRALKVVKRKLRSQLLLDGRNSDGSAAPPYRIRSAVFEASMDELLRAQVAAEDVRHRLSVRTDLLDLKGIEKARMALRYGARYFHDVYQDFERCAVVRDGEYYVVTDACRNLSDFLTSRSLPSDLPEESRARLQACILKLRTSNDLAERHATLLEIEELRRLDLPFKRRYRAVATEAFGLAGAELGSALRSIRNMEGGSGPAS